MAVMRVVVGATQVFALLIRLRPARSTITMTGTNIGDRHSNVTWHWDGKPTTFGTMTGTTSITMATMTTPTWEESRQRIGQDRKSIDWIHSPYPSKVSDSPLGI